MSHWFHRNPLKATTKQSFELGLAASNTPSRQLCSDIATKRVKLLDMLCDPNLEIESLKEAVNQYISLLLGFMNEPEAGTASSKIRNAIKFKWTNSLSVKGDLPLEQHDSVFEFINMMTNVALWYSKHAAKVASKENVTMDEAKEVHSSLRMAAGIFKELRDNYVNHLIEKGPKASDIDDRVLEAYFNQCTAEAQEVTMARAVELNHSPNIIAALAFETSKMFQAADLALSTLEEKYSTKWRKYLQFKRACYRAYAYSYKGESLLNEEKGGDAIASLKEALKCCQDSSRLATEYCRSQGPGITVRPQDHFFYRRLQPHVQRTMEKCERENGLIYHQKVPAEIPDLELKATFGLVQPEPYPLPEFHVLWKEAYKGFDCSQLNTGVLKDGQAKDEKKKEDPVQPMKEKPIYESHKDPSNNSGCILS